MLRERGFDVVEAADMLDAMAALQRDGAFAFVVNANVGEDECALCLRAVARRFAGTTLRCIGVGPRPALVGDAADAWVDSEYRYVAVVAAVGAPPHERATRHAATTSSLPEPVAAQAVPSSQTTTGALPVVPAPTAAVAPEADASMTPGETAPQVRPVVPPAAGRVATVGPMTLAEIHRLLQVARFDTYADLLGVPADAAPAAVTRAAESMLARLDDDRVPVHVFDAAFSEVLELRAAIEDAAAVLASLTSDAPR